jgi:ketosteroid isomerase-like protein
MVSVSEMFKAFDEGFTNQDSSKLGEFFTDDFQFVAARRTMDKKRYWTGLREVATRRSWVI